MIARESTEAPSVDFARLALRSALQRARPTRYAEGQCRQGNNSERCYHTMEGRRASRERLLKLLDELESTPSTWTSVYFRAESLHDHPERLLPRKTEQRLDDIAATIESDHMERETKRYGTGLALFHSGDSVTAIVPPFPVAEDSVATGDIDTAPLRELLERPRRIVLVLVTWGAWVLALYDGKSVERYKKGTGHIHAPHKKGGSSSARFARRTEEQRKEFLKRVGRHIDEQLLDAQRVDHIYFGGNRLILRPLMEDSRFLRQHATLISPRTLLVKRATRDTLDGAHKEAQSGVLFETPPPSSPSEISGR